MACFCSATMAWNRTAVDTALAAEHIEVTGMRIAMQRLLHLQRQPVYAASHVRRLDRKPHTHAGRRQDHPRRTDITRRSAAAFTPSSTRTRTPPLNSISINPVRRCGRLSKPGASASGASAGADTTRAGNRRPVLSSPFAEPAIRRHRYIRLGQIPWRKATSCTRAPADIASVTTIRRNAASWARRRSPTISIRANASTSVAATVAASPVILFIHSR